MNNIRVKTVDSLHADISDLIQKYADENMYSEIIDAFIANAVGLEISILYVNGNIDETYRKMYSLLVEHVERTKMLLSEVMCG